MQLPTPDSPLILPHAAVLSCLAAVSSITSALNKCLFLLLSPLHNLCDDHFHSFFFFLIINL